MKLPLLSSLLCLAIVSPLVAQAAGEAETTAAKPVFGPYEAIAYDRAYLQGVRTDEAGNVFLMFQPDKRGTQLVVRISMQKGAPYRPWFTGDIDLVAQENVGREPNTWTDRIQTTANYIEYRDGQNIFLHLKKIKS